MAIYPRINPNGNNKSISNKKYTQILWSNICPFQNTMIIRLLWTKHRKIGVNMKKIIIYGSKSKKIHAELNQIYHFFQNKYSLSWFPLQQVPGSNDISLSMGKANKLHKHGCSINSSKREHTNMTIWQEYYLFMRNYTQRLDMFKEWMKF